MKQQDQTLTEYLKTLRCLEKISEGNYTFVFDYCWCSGTVTIENENEYLKIKPMHPKHDIGKSAGQMLVLKFKKAIIT